MWPLPDEGRCEWVGTLVGFANRSTSFLRSPCVDTSLPPFRHVCSDQEESNSLPVWRRIAAKIRQHLAEQATYECLFDRGQTSDSLGFELAPYFQDGFFQGATSFGQVDARDPRIFRVWSPFDQPGMLHALYHLRCCWRFN